ncbi:hypothetical protein LJR098_002290 [Rhizobium sp. LjRoot98]|uniref:hypothetical protein n=1 Tax=Rhizobium sp. LjRoot98 TaxID=3342345 RepID=UPI003ECD0414
MSLPQLEFGAHGEPPAGGIQFAAGFDFQSFADAVAHVVIARVGCQAVLVDEVGTERWFRALHSALRGKVARTRVGVSTLSKYASNSDEFRESLIPVDIAVEADRRAGSPIIIKEAARQLGYQLTPLQEALRSGTRISERDAHVILSEAMDVSRGLISAFEDGKIDSLERKQLRKELRELIRAAEDILHRMEDE